MTPMGQFINEMRDLAEPKREGLRDGANGGSADSEDGEKTRREAQITSPAGREPSWSAQGPPYKCIGRPTLSPQSASSRIMSALILSRCAQGRAL
jgi:hypothetical protein